ASSTAACRSVVSSRARTSPAATAWPASTSTSATGPLTSNARSTCRTGTIVPVPVTVTRSEPRSTNAESSTSTPARSPTDCCAFALTTTTTTTATTVMTSKNDSRRFILSPEEIERLRALAERDHVALPQPGKHFAILRTLQAKLNLRFAQAAIQQHLIDISTVEAPFQPDELVRHNQHIFPRFDDDLRSGGHARAHAANRVDQRNVDRRADDPSNVVTNQADKLQRGGQFQIRKRVDPHDGRKPFTDTPDVDFINIDRQP